jgi:hypothetical protein
MFARKLALVALVLTSALAGCGKAPATGTDVEQQLDFGKAIDARVLPSGKANPGRSTVNGVVVNGRAYPAGQAPKAEAPKLESPTDGRGHLLLHVKLGGRSVQTDTLKLEISHGNDLSVKYLSKDELNATTAVKAFENLAPATYRIHVACLTADHIAFQNEDFEVKVEAGKTNEFQL